MIKPLNPSLAAIWEYPEPMLLKSIDLIQSMNANIYGGYKYKEKHAKKEAGAAGTASDQGTGKLFKDHYTTGVAKSE